MTASSDPSLTLEELIQVCDQIDAECDCPVMIGPDKIDYSKDAGDNKHSFVVVTRKFGPATAVVVGDSSTMPRCV